MRSWPFIGAVAAFVALIAGVIIVAGSSTGTTVTAPVAKKPVEVVPVAKVVPRPEKTEPVAQEVAEPDSSAKVDVPAKPASEPDAPAVVDLQNDVAVSAPPEPESKPESKPDPKKPEPKPEPKPVDPSDEFFDKGIIPQIKISISNKEEQKLRQDQRRYVDCTLIENGETTYRKVHVKLKGAAGSFRGIDDRACFTLHMTKKGERFHGLDKFHLNNSVQDESLLCELLASQICREAGCPTPRTTHARVWLNNRDLGMYVLKEGFAPDFLKRNFGENKGNLYDGGFIRDVDQNLEKDEGEGTDDLSDLKALVTACREGDANKRWKAIAKTLDVDAFLNFMALELMMSHWDGYIQNRNNYRIYFRTNDSRAVFMPHGMDQMFADPNFSVFHHPGPIVPNAVLHNPEWKAKYRQRVKDLLPLFAPAKLNARIDAVHARLRPVLAAISEDRAKQHDARVQDIKNRLATRAQSIRQQLGATPEPFVFKDGFAKLEGWTPKPEGDAKLEEQEIDGRAVYLMQTGPSNRANVSYRRRIPLTQGSYRLEAKAKLTGVTPIEDGGNRGFGLRLSGGKRDNQLVGTTDWQTVTFPIEIPEASREVEVVIELRATAGSAAVDMESLRVAKVK